MIEDSVLQEVRAAREAFARKHGYDVWSMVAYLHQQNERGDWPVVRLAPRRCTQHGDFRSEPPSTNEPTSIPAMENAPQAESGQAGKSD
jgi:hypothetical protein